MKVLAMKRDPSKITPEANAYVDKVLSSSSPDDIDELLSTCDFVTCILPSTPSTLNFMDKQKFQKMKNSAVFINVGRGNTANEQDLIEALQTGVIRGAYLDVCATEPLPEDSPLWTMENVYLTPHCGNRSERLFHVKYDRFTGILRQFVSGEELEYQVDREAGY